MGSSLHDIGEGEGGPQNVRLFLPGSGPSSPVIWRVDVGGDPMNWTSPGEFPPQSVHRDVRDSTTETDGRDLGSPPDKIFYACGGLGGDGELHIQAP